MNAEERREFVRANRTCVFGYERKDGPPSMSIVYYTMDGNDLLISTMAGRAKAKAVDRLGEVSICVLDVFSPPVHLNAGDDGSKLEHGYGQRLAWTSEDVGNALL